MSYTTNSEKIALIQSIFGHVDAHNDGVNVSVRCPNKECPSSKIAANKRKFCIRLDDNRTHCWVCGIKGHLAKILRLHVGNDALIKFGGALTTGRRYAEQNDGPKPVSLPADFRLLGPLLGTSSPHVNSYIKYLYGRGLTDRDIWFFKFGISDEPTWKSRIIMPSFDADGNLNWLVGRTIVDRTRPKYIDPEGDKIPIVFNEINIDWTKNLTIVEGPFDLTKCDDNATCLLGSNFSDQSRLLEMITSHNTPIIMALDSDVKQKADRIAMRVHEFDVDVRVLDLGNYKDVGEMTRDEFLVAKDDAKPWTWNTHIMGKINTIMTSSIMGRN